MLKKICCVVFFSVFSSLCWGVDRADDFGVEDLLFEDEETEKQNSNSGGKLQLSVDALASLQEALEEISATDLAETLLQQSSDVAKQEHVTGLHAPVPLEEDALFEMIEDENSDFEELSDKYQEEEEEEGPDGLKPSTCERMVECLGRTTDCVASAARRCWRALGGKEGAEQWAARKFDIFRAHWNFLKKKKLLPALEKDLMKTIKADLMYILGLQLALFTIDNLTPNWNEIGFNPANLLVYSLGGTGIALCYFAVIRGITRLYIHVIPSTMAHVGRVHETLKQSIEPVCLPEYCTIDQLRSAVGSSFTSLLHLALLPVLRIFLKPQFSGLLTLIAVYNALGSTIESAFPNLSLADWNLMIEQNSIKIASMATLCTLPNIFCPSLSLGFEALKVVATLPAAGLIACQPGLIESVKEKCSPSMLNRIVYRVLGWPRLLVQKFMKPAEKAMKANIFDGDPGKFPIRLVKAADEILSWADFLSSKDCGWKIKLVRWLLVPQELYNAERFCQDPILKPLINPQHLENFLTIMDYVLTVGQVLTKPQGFFDSFIKKTVEYVVFSENIKAKIASTTGLPPIFINWIEILLENKTSIEELETIRNRVQRLHDAILNGHIMEFDISEDKKTQ